MNVITGCPTTMCCTNFRVYINFYYNKIISKMSDSTDTIDLPYLRHLKWDETVVMSGNRKLIYFMLE